MDGYTLLATHWRDYDDYAALGESEVRPGLQAGHFGRAVISGFSVDSLFSRPGEAIVLDVLENPDPIWGIKLRLERAGAGPESGLCCAWLCGGEPELLRFHTGERTSRGGIAIAKVLRLNADDDRDIVAVQDELFAKVYFYRKRWPGHLYALFALRVVIGESPAVLFVEKWKNQRYYDDFAAGRLTKTLKEVGLDLSNFTTVEAAVTIAVDPSHPMPDPEE